MILHLLVLHGSRTDGVITVGLQDVKISFRPQIGAIAAVLTSLNG